MTMISYILMIIIIDSSMIIQVIRSKPKSISTSTSCINGVCESITIKGDGNESISSNVTMVGNNGTITTTKKSRLCKGCLCLLCKDSSCIIRRRRSRKCYRLIRRLIRKKVED